MSASRLLVAGATALLIAGCGGDDDDNAATVPTPAPERTAAPAPRSMNVQDGTMTLRLDSAASRMLDAIGLGVAATGDGTTDGRRLQFPSNGGEMRSRPRAAGSSSPAACASARAGQRGRHRSRHRCSKGRPHRGGPGPARPAAAARPRRPACRASGRRGVHRSRPCVGDRQHERVGPRCGRPPGRTAARAHRGLGAGLMVDP